MKIINTYRAAEGTLFQKDLSDEEDAIDYERMLAHGVWMWDERSEPTGDPYAATRIYLRNEDSIKFLRGKFGKELWQDLDENAAGLYAWDYKTDSWRSISLDDYYLFETLCRLTWSARKDFGMS